MRNKIQLLVVVLLQALPFAVTGQGTFSNLGFESANLPNVPINQPGGSVSMSLAMPAWTGYIGTTPVSQILHNDFTLGASSISILGPQSSSSVILEGSYTALLTAGSSGDVSLAQTATVPASVQSLLFKARTGNGSFSVYMGGNFIGVTPLQVTSGYTLYGGNIASFAGQSSELKFTSFSIFSQGGGLNTFYLDSLAFSNQPVPEPSALGLFGLGALLFNYRSRLVLRKRF